MVDDMAVVGPVQPGKPAPVIGAVQALRRGILELTKKLELWSDDELAQLFAETSTLEGAFYAARCYVCHLLAQRHGQGDEPSGLKRAAQILGISYSYARELSAIWSNILGKLEDNIPSLPPSFFSRALRATQYGVDPVEAISHAIHVREALGQPYSVQQFEQDIRKGLPTGDGTFAPSCTLCTHYALAAGRLVLISDNGAPVAEAETDGMRYCAKYGILRSGLGDPRVRAAECPEYRSFLEEQDRDEKETGEDNRPPPSPGGPGAGS